MSEENSASMVTLRTFFKV